MFFSGSPYVVNIAPLLKCPTAEIFFLEKLHALHSCNTKGYVSSPLTHDSNFILIYSDFARAAVHLIDAYQATVIDSVPDDLASLLSWMAKNFKFNPLQPIDEKYIPVLELEWNKAIEAGRFLRRNPPVHGMLEEVNIHIEYWQRVVESRQEQARVAAAATSTPVSSPLVSLPSAPATVYRTPQEGQQSPHTPVGITNSSPPQSFSSSPSYAIHRPSTLSRRQLPSREPVPLFTPFEPKTRRAVQILDPKQSPCPAKDGCTKKEKRPYMHST